MDMYSNYILTSLNYPTLGADNRNSSDPKYANYALR